MYNQLLMLNSDELRYLEIDQLKALIGTTDISIDIHLAMEEFADYPGDGQIGFTNYPSEEYNNKQAIYLAYLALRLLERSFGYSYEKLNKAGERFTIEEVAFLNHSYEELEGAYGRYDFCLTVSQVPKPRKKELVYREF